MEIDRSGVNIPDNLLQFIREEASRIHHGKIVIEINRDKPNKIDVVTEHRQRFQGITNAG